MQPEAELRRPAARPQGLQLHSPTAISFGVLFAAAVALRVYAISRFPPAVLNGNVHDGAGYLLAVRRGIAWNSQEPSGYPLFLRVVHFFSDNFAATIGVQHALGLAAGTLLFGAVRRLGVPAWVGLFPAAIVWFNGDQLFLEHAPLTEALFTFALAAVVYASVRCLRGGGPAWPLIAGALAASLLTIRSVGLPVPLVVVGWVALARWRLALPWRRGAALAAAAAIAVTGGYVTVRHHATDRWSVVADGSGWLLYARAAAFADCRKFTPPHGTRILCERTPPSTRPGPGFYLYEGGPARAAFGGPGFHDDRVSAFARAAIVHQPLDYLELVWTDLVHYVDPEAGPHRYAGYSGPEGVAFPSGRPPIDVALGREVAAYYAPFGPPHGRPAHGLWSYQRVMRVNGIVLLILLVLGCAGALAARGRVRWGLLLSLAIGLDLVLAPALTHTEWRYTVPAEGPAATAAALGVWAGVRRLAQMRRSERPLHQV